MRSLIRHFPLQVIATGFSLCMLAQHSWSLIKIILSNKRKEYFFSSWFRAEYLIIKAHFLEITQCLTRDFGIKKTELASTSSVVMQPLQSYFPLNKVQSHLLHLLFFHRTPAEGSKASSVAAWQFDANISWLQKGCNDGEISNVLWHSLVYIILLLCSKNILSCAKKKTCPPVNPVSLIVLVTEELTDVVVTVNTDPFRPQRHKIPETYDNKWKEPLPTGMQRMSACSCISNLLDVIPPSTWSWVSGMPLSWFMASNICHPYISPYYYTNTRSCSMCQTQILFSFWEIREGAYLSCLETDSFQCSKCEMTLISKLS